MADDVNGSGTVSWVQAYGAVDSGASYMVVIHGGGNEGEWLAEIFGILREEEEVGGGWVEGEGGGAEDLEGEGEDDVSQLHSGQASGDGD